jgi:hypothetical protein
MVGNLGFADVPLFAFRDLNMSMEMEAIYLNI